MLSHICFCFKQFNRRCAILESRYYTKSERPTDTFQFAHYYVNRNDVWVVHEHKMTFHILLQDIRRVWCQYGSSCVELGILMQQNTFHTGHNYKSRKKKIPTENRWLPEIDPEIPYQSPNGHHLSLNPCPVTLSSPKKIGITRRKGWNGSELNRNKQSEGSSLYGKEPEKTTNCITETMIGKQKLVLIIGLIGSFVNGSKSICGRHWLRNIEFLYWSYQRRSRLYCSGYGWI